MIDPSEKVSPGTGGSSPAGVALEQRPSGIILPIQAQPGGKHNGVTGVHNGHLKVTVTQAPEKGKANHALVKVLAELLGLKRSQFELIAGSTSHQKQFCITGVSLIDMHRRVNALFPTKESN